MNGSWLRRYVALSFAIFLVFLNPGGSLAYTGGPALAEILGWDEREQKIYVLECGPGEVGSCRMSYFALGSVNPERKWRSAREITDDSQLDSLKARLKPLVYWPSEALSGHVEVTPHDSVDVPIGRIPRFQLDVSYYMGEFQGVRFRLLSFGREFVIKDVYRIPGRDDFLLLVTFRGNPYGMFEETQVPILILKGKWQDLHEVSWSF